MSEEAKQRLKFAIFTAEANDELCRVHDEIHDKLRSFHGGYWSVLGSGNDYEAYFKADNLAVFDYNGNRWNDVYVSLELTPESVSYSYEHKLKQKK